MDSTRISRIVRRSVGKNIVNEAELKGIDGSSLADMIHLLYIENESDTNQMSLVQDFAKQVLRLNLVDTNILKERLDVQLLESIGLLPSAQVFSRKVIRINTNLMYRQQKFNLMREESEGWSKILSEITSMLSTMSHDCSEEELEEKVQLTLRNLSSLIGYFELDPNRALDILLDCFVVNVVEHYRFFVKLFLASPWKPKMHMSDPTQQTTVQVSNPIFGQLIGFKFAHFASGDSSSPNAPTYTHLNLYWVTAILLKHKIFALDDVYPHLGPQTQEASEAEYKLYLQELSTKAANSARFVSVGLTGTLSEPVPSSQTTSSSSSKADESAQKPKFEPRNIRMNQKAGMSACLLALGEVDLAKQILNTDIRMVNMYPEIADAINRFLLFSTENFYQTKYPLLFTVVPSLPAGAETGTAATSKKCIVTANLKLSESSRLSRVSGKWTVYKFFYSDWTPKHLSCSSYQEFRGLISSWFPYIGPHLNRDLKLLNRVIRIAKLDFELNKSHETSTFYSSLISQYLFPALAQLGPNPALVNQLFSLVSQFPYLDRFALYKQWKTKTYDSMPELRVSKTGCMKDTRYIMRRLSKETVKQYGRQIGKVVHSNPTVAFALIIDQLQSYDNQIPHVVEASRYMTDFGFDVFTHCLVEALSKSNKERIQSSGTLIAKWLTNLATLCGNLGRRHSIELQSILQYLARQLSLGNIYDLVVLQELIDQMCGVKILDDTSDSQLEAFAGGETLRREALMYENIRLIRKSSARLTNALLESGLAGKLAVLIAQMRREIVHLDEDARDLKILAWRFDFCHKTFVQYMSFLVSNIDKSSYPSLFGTVLQLVDDFKLEYPIAFHMIRPKLEILLKKSSQLVNTNTAWIDQASSSSLTTEQTGHSQQTDNQMSIDQPETTAASTTKHNADWWDAQLFPTISQVSTLLPAQVTDMFTPAFYVTFWQLSLYDIYLPQQRYKAEISRFQQLVNKVDSQIQMETSTSAMNKLKKEKEKHLSSRVLLEKELTEQQLHISKVNLRIEKEKEFWIQREHPKFEASTLFLKYFVYPRCLCTPEDAMFTALFCFRLHSLGTRNWSFLAFLDCLMSQEALQNMLFSLSENEAKNYGTFLAQVMHRLTAWHLSNTAYDQEAKGEGLYGFMKGNVADSGESGSTGTQDHYEWDEFRRIMLKWHQNLRKALMCCLESKEYMRTRNSIILLDRIRDSYPIVKEYGDILIKTIKNIEDTEQRGDLKQLARSYFAKMQSFKSKWIKKSDFCPQSVLLARQSSSDSLDSQAISTISEPAASQLVENLDSSHNTMENTGIALATPHVAAPHLVPHKSPANTCHLNSPTVNDASINGLSNTKTGDNLDVAVDYELESVYNSPHDATFASVNGNYSETHFANASVTVSESLEPAKHEINDSNAEHSVHENEDKGIAHVFHGSQENVIVTEPSIANPIHAVNPTCISLVNDQSIDKNTVDQLPSDISQTTNATNQTTNVVFAFRQSVEASVDQSVRSVEDGELNEEVLRRRLVASLDRKQRSSSRPAVSEAKTASLTVDDIKTVNKEERYPKHNERNGTNAGRFDRDDRRLREDRPSRIIDRSRLDNNRPLVRRDVPLRRDDEWNRPQRRQEEPLRHDELRFRRGDEPVRRDGDRVRLEPRRDEPMRRDDERVRLEPRRDEQFYRRDDSDDRNDRSKRRENDRNGAFNRPRNGQSRSHSRDDILPERRPFDRPDREGNFNDYDRDPKRRRFVDEQDGHSSKRRPSDYNDRRNDYDHSKYDGRRMNRPDQRR